MKIYSIAKRMPPSIYHTAILKRACFFLNLIQLSQSLTLYLFVRVNLKFGNFKKIFNEFISGNKIGKNSQEIFKRASNSKVQQNLHK